MAGQNSRSLRLIAALKLPWPALLGLLLWSPSLVSASGPEHAVSPTGFVRIVDRFPGHDQHIGQHRKDVSRQAQGSQRLPAPMEDTFKLHSLPGASKVIYLDFDGHEVNWFDEYYRYDAWNLEGSPDTFSAKERAIIQQAWQSIAEDFLPFEIDVTTEFPGLEALRKRGDGDEAWGVRAVINHNAYDYSWAYQGSFSDSEDTELFAWSGDDPDEYETWLWIADSVSHEVGHTLGLRHDGTTGGVEYYEGHGRGKTAWSPIMGWTNYGLSQWDNGAYTDANNGQNDLRVITSRNGFGYRPDDHGSSTETATPIDLSAASFAEGIIERSDDLDFFVFSVNRQGPYRIRVSPHALAPNLDISARLYDVNGSQLDQDNPPRALTAGFDVTLEAGVYYLSVDGTGFDDPESDGYSDYGSLGYYRIQIASVERGHVAGTYFDPQRDGEGCQVTLEADEAAIVLTCYMFLKGEQIWLISAGNWNQGEVLFDNITISSGANWGTAFQASAVIRERFGSAVMVWEDCNNATLTLAPELPDFEALALDFTKIAPGSCAAAPRSRTSKPFAGTFYDPRRDGEGFQLVAQGDSDVYALSFYSYVNGQQAWLIGVGVPENNRLVFNEMVITRGADYGRNFKSADVVREPWGSITLDFADCNKALMTVVPLSSQSAFSPFTTTVEKVIPGPCP